MATPTRTSCPASECSRPGGRTDFLSGFGVFAAGRNHPVIRQALHDALDAQLADWTQFDCGPLPGLLAQRLLAKAPGLDRVFFCNSGTEAVESALKFARYATGRGRVIYCDHAFHGLTTGSLSINGSAEFRRGFDPLLPDTSRRRAEVVDRWLRGPGHLRGWRHRRRTAALAKTPGQGQAPDPAGPGDHAHGLGDRLPYQPPQAAPQDRRWCRPTGYR